MHRLLGVRLLLLLLGCVLAGTDCPEAAADDPPAPAQPPAAGLRQDVVHLENGASFSGRIVRDDGDVVILESRSDAGGLARFSFPRTRIARIERGSGEEIPRGGVRPVRDDWFLLRSGGRVVGLRHLELWSIRDGGEPAFRLEETIELFAQGTHLPAIRAVRTEITDLRFALRLATWREIGETRAGDGGARRYERSVSGRIKDEVWFGAVLDGGEARQVRVAVTPGTRGRLGLREHLLRRGPAQLGLESATILDPALEGLVTLRAGFASAEDLGRGLEFHWEEDGQRRVSWFPTTPGGVVREEVREGLEAQGVGVEQAEAARQQALGTAADPEQLVVELPEAGVGFRLPDVLWTWQARLPAPNQTGWRVLGGASQSALLANLRAEWHPYESESERSEDGGAAWLLQRLRGVAPDLTVLLEPTPMSGLAGAWRMIVSGNLKATAVHTIAVVVDRPTGRVVLLLAIPSAGWEDGRGALERILASLYLL